MAQDFSPALSASDEIHDFHLIALTDDRFIERGAFEHGDVVLDGDAARVDLEVAEQFGDGQRTAELDPVPIQGNSQRPRTRPILSQSTMSLEWDNDLWMLDREAVIAWYLRNRERTRTLFDLVAGGGAEGDGAYYKRPIALRHPIVFYEGHLPAFSFNTLVKKGLGGPSIDPRLEALFARGIDPHEAGPRKARRQEGGPHDVRSERAGWPTRDEVHAFAAEADRRVLDALCRADLERPGHPLLDRGEAVFTILEHEAMHHETLLYMWHRLSLEDKHRPDGYAPRVDGPVPRQEWVEIPGGSGGPGGPGGVVTLGVNRDDLIFGWDNEFPRHVVAVDTFSIERFNVTNAQFLEFVDAGGYTDRRWWREEDWNWIQSERVSHPLFWEGGDEGGKGRTRAGRATSGVVLAGHVRAHSAAARVAGVRQSRRGRGLRAVARRPTPDRS